MGSEVKFATPILKKPRILRTEKEISTTIPDNSPLQDNIDDSHMVVLSNDDDDKNSGSLPEEKVEQELEQEQEQERKSSNIDSEIIMPKANSKQNKKEETKKKKKKKKGSKGMQTISDIPMAKVYRPSLEEFLDPYRYIVSIKEEAAEYGIVKIVPPEGWQLPPHSLDIYPSSRKIFPTKKQRVNHLARG